MREVQPCGTYAAYQRHIGRGEAACQPCKDARKKYMDNWADENSDLVAGYGRDRPPRKARPDPVKSQAYKLKERYGLTPEQREVMFETQGRMCASCQAVETYGRQKHWQVEHNHETKVIRGITCARCNRLIGQLGDTIGAVAGSMTMFLAYLARAGETLSDEEIEKVVSAIRSRTTYVPESAVVAMDPDRPPKPRHRDQR